MKPEYCSEPTKNTISPGAFVRIVDGSWSLEIMPDGILKTTYPAADRSTNVNRWKVLAINCVLPTEDRHPLGEKYPGNTCILQNVHDTSRVLFSDPSRLALATH